MQLIEFFEKFGYEIHGGSEYQWNAYGDNAWRLDMAKEVEVLYDKVTTEVYELSVWSEVLETSVLWVNPAYKNALIEEASHRGFPFKGNEFVSELENMFRLINQALNEQPLNLDLCDHAD